MPDCQVDPGAARRLRTRFAEYYSDATFPKWSRRGPKMASRTLTFDLPEEIVALVGSPDTAATRARTALLMTLLGDGVISEGQAARLLGITRWELMDLMREYRVPSGPEDAEDVRREFAEAQRTARQQSGDDRR